MSFRVTILPRAKRQLLEQAIWWSSNLSAEQALRWLDGFEQAVASLENDPGRFPLARENDAFDFEIRELHYGVRSRATHRVVFEIRGEEVIVYSIRHLAQRDLLRGDLP